VLLRGVGDRCSPSASSAAWHRGFFGACAHAYCGDFNREVAQPSGRIFPRSNIVAGILLAYLSNYLIGRMNLGQAEWRMAIGLRGDSGVVVFLPSVFHTAQSALVGDRESHRLRRLTGNRDPERELAEIMHSIWKARRQPSRCLTGSMDCPFFLAVTAAAFKSTDRRERLPLLLE
jgi:hypothetical protein